MLYIININLNSTFSALSADLQQDLAIIKTTTSSLLAECNDLMAEAKSQFYQMNRAISRKDTQSKQLQRTLVSLAVDHERLEKTAMRAQNAGTLLPLEETQASDNDEEEFFDLDDNSTEPQQTPHIESESVPAPKIDTSLPHHVKSVSESVLPPPHPTTEAGPLVPIKNTAAPALRRVSVPYRPNVKLSLWSVMKNSIGKDLSKIPMPVHFNEPLSFNQRLVEDLEYSSLLDRAAKSTNAYERLALVSAFTVSAFACISLRVGKPFNPLLAETFEADRRDDYGWRAITEQVSHHPPICSLYSEGRGWIFWQEFSMNSKFRGKYLEVIPTGISHVLIPATNDHFTWTKVPTSIHNIIVGKLWCDNHGVMDITNHTNGDVCTLTYTPYSYFTSGSARKVTGVLKDRGGLLRGNMEGTWDTELLYSTVAKPDDKILLWKRDEPLPDCEKMYGFTRLALSLNEMTPIDRNCAPTDSRFRQDKNVMETGDFDRANVLKEKLEEAQRARRRTMEKEGKHWSPVWFKEEPDPCYPDRTVHVYKGGYWEAKADNSWDKYDLPKLYDI